MMHIAILGTGNVGQALGGGWARRGHNVVFGSREPQAEKAQALVQALGAGVSAESLQTAVNQAEVVVLAIPWRVCQETVTGLTGWDGKILIDAINPIAPGLQLAVGHTTSAAELIAGWAPGARVVKAFNSTGANNMANPVYEGAPITLFIGGDDREAKATVAGLAEGLGFDVADVGGLITARWLEPLAMIWISLAMGQGQGRDIAFKLARR